MIDYSSLYDALEYTQAATWLSSLPADIDEAFHARRHGELSKWLSVLNSLPEYHPSSVDLKTGVRIGEADDINDVQRLQLEELLRSLHPWRKGPYELFGIHVDTEWHSDWKWNRIKPHLSNLEGQVILDVGCGNGYHCLRMAGEGARLAVGIDPSQLFTMQFHAIKHFLDKTPAHVVPLGIEHLPPNLAAFDTVFSMGVLYHRRSPFDHLLELRQCLRPGGELVLETLVIDGEEGKVLVPQDRYAQMRNVWFIPSAPTLVAWLQRCGYEEVRVVDVSLTTVKEQRSTDWMTFDSLPKFLDPEDSSKTIEGMPAPQRAVVIAKSP